jgi:hypothetical protein
MRAYAYTIRPPTERASFREFAALCEAEPRLVALLVDVMRSQPTTGQFYRSVKPQLEQLVGWTAQVASLRNGEAYDTAYEVLYSMVVDP